jgi:uncharacterized membrane protein
MWGNGAARHPRRTGGRIVIVLEKALDVRAPVRDIFAAAAIERLPEVVPHLREARSVAVDRHHWIMDDPPEPAIEWDTVITRFGANQVIGWETPPGSVIRHIGRIALRPNPDGSTRVSLDLSFVLPPGPFGQRVAALLRSEDVDEGLRHWRARLEGRAVAVAAHAAH